MTVNVNLNIAMSVSSTSAAEKDLGNLSTSLSSNAMGEGGTRKFLLAAGSTDVELELTNISDIRLLFIKVSPKNDNDPAQGITIKRNDVAGESIPIVPFDDKKIGYFLLTTDSLTSLYATNAGSVDVELTIGSAGD